MNISDLQPGSFTVNSSGPTQTSGASAYSSYLSNIKSGKIGGSTQDIISKYGGGKGTPGANSPAVTGTDPRMQNLPSTSTAGNYMGSLKNAAGNAFVQPEKDAAAYAGTRIAQAGVQTYNEFQNPGYDTAVDSGNPQRHNAGGTATPLPVNAGPTPTNTSNSEANINKPQNELGVTVDPQKQGAEGALQIGNQALTASAAIGNVGMAEGLVSQINKLPGLAASVKSAIEDILVPKGTSSLHLPNVNGQNLYAKITPEQQAFLKNEIENIPSSETDKPHLTPNTKLESPEIAKTNEAAQPGSAPKRVSLDEIKAQSPNAKAALDKFDAQNAPKTEPTATTPTTSKLSPEQQELQNNITQSQKDLGQAKTQTDIATQQRNAITPQVVKATSDVQSGVKSGERALGVTFGKAPAQIEATDPSLRLNISQQDLNELNTIKEDRKFSLPDNLDQEKAGPASNFMPKDPVARAKLQAQIDKAGGETTTSLTPTQTQDLIKQLNAKVYNPVTGEVDQRIVGLVNKIKSNAQASFGHIVDAQGNSVWNEAYQNYAKGMQTVDDFKTLLGVNPNKDLAEISPNKLMDKINELGKTPEGKLQLQQAAEELKQSTGTDLSDPIKTVQQLADKQTALDEANANLSEAKKAAFKAQRDSDIAQLKHEQKMSTFKGRHPILTNNLQYFAKRGAWQLTGGAVIGALGISALMKKVMSGK